MLQLQGSSGSFCDGVTRRSMLQIGSLGMGAFSISSLLQVRRSQAASDRRDTAIILFWLAGGPSHIDMYDMKPDMPAEVSGPFRPIRTKLSGLEVCELMPRHVGIAKDVAVIRSIRHNLSVHDDASHWLQTGWPLLNARAQGQQNPSQGSVVAALKGANRSGVPAYVCIPEDYRRHMGFYEAAAFLSSRFNAVNAGGDPSLGNYRPPDFSLPPELHPTRLENRRVLMQSLDRWKKQVESSAEYRALEDAQLEALQLATSTRAREAFDLSREPDRLKDRYGRHAWGQSALLARRLVEAGVTFVNINFYERDVDWWDDHYTIEPNLRKRLPLYDQAICGLIEDIQARGLADRVMVAAFGEFGRSPRIDRNAGRGHWPGAMSAMLFGGGIRGGQVVGSTTADGGEPKTRPLLPGDLLATMYHVLGIDHNATLRDRQNRPVPLFDAGRPIAELL